MKIKLSVSFIIAFISLVFLIQELHDWAHVFVSEWICGCIGTKAFNKWSLCDHCEVSGNIMVLVWLAGPAINYSLMWIAWSMMSRRNSAERKSFGFCLFFATNPFASVLAAITGGGDMTYSMRMLFQAPDGSNRHVVSIASLVIVLILSVPPFLKAFSMLKGKMEKLILTPSFLLVPNYIVLLFVTLLMNRLLDLGFFEEEVFSGAPLLVIMWLILVTIFYSIYYKSLSGFIKKKEKKTVLRV